MEIEILIKETVNQADITILNTHAPNSSAANFIKNLLLDLRALINNNSLIVGDTPFSISHFL